MITAEKVSYAYPFARGRALSDVNFNVEKGQSVLVTGRSGCGKSTLIKTLNGLIPAHFKGSLLGDMTVAGIEFPAPIERISRKVGTVLQNPEDQFFTTNVYDEAALFLEWENRRPAHIRQRVSEILNGLGISHLAGRSVFTLSQGEKQKAVIASLLAAEPEILVMDEPTANLSPESTMELGDICLELKSRGITVVIADHRLYWLRGQLDRAFVLEGGSSVFTAEKLNGGEVMDELQKAGGTGKWGLRSPNVKEHSLPPANTGAGDSFLVENLCFSYRSGGQAVSDYSCAIPSGTVTALTGGNGSGKTTLGRLLCGLERASSGRISKRGRPLRPANLRKMAGFVMQQTELQLYMKTVEDELIFSAPRECSASEKTRTAYSIMERFGLDKFTGRHPHSLSGGEKQRLVIASALIKNPALLVLDEPTSGLDGRNMAIISREIKNFAREGGAVLLITHDLELLQTIADYQITMGRKA